MSEVPSRSPEADRVHRVLDFAKSLGTPVSATIMAALILTLASLGYREITRSDPYLGGWSPPRVEYRCGAVACANADHVTFNSTINMPSYGDERSFVDARLAGDDVDEFRDPIHVDVGDVVVVRAYIDNNANPARVPDGDGTADNTSIRFEIPYSPNDDQLVRGNIMADNASPPAVSDTVRLLSDEPFGVSLVEDSAQLRNSVFKDGFELESAIVAEGVFLGIEEDSGEFCCRLNGTYPACDPTEPDCEVFASVVELKLLIIDPDHESTIVRLRPRS